jgi:hypothetical protein
MKLIKLDFNKDYIMRIEIEIGSLNGCEYETLIKSLLTTHLFIFLQHQEIFKLIKTEYKINLFIK